LTAIAIAVAGCSSAASQSSTTAPAASSAAASSPAPASSPATTATSVTTASSAPASSSATASSSQQAAVPVLGHRAGIFDTNSEGFGEVRPATVFNGGDPTGLVTKISWSSWGSSTATGTGLSDYVGPNQAVAAGTQEKVTIVAFNLGTCSGKLMYQAVEWYFPQHGQKFNAKQYENICTGTYVGQ
jgi:hypothetical protein